MPFFSIGEHMMVYVEDVQENPYFDVAILYEFPQGILFKHSVCSWIYAYQALKKKIGVRRRWLK